MPNTRMKRGLTPPGTVDTSIGTAATGTTPTGRPRKRRRMHRSAGSTATATQHLSVPRRSATGTAESLALIGNFINFAQAMKGFRPGVDVQSLYNGWVAAQGLGG